MEFRGYCQAKHLVMLVIQNALFVILSAAKYP